MKTILVMAVLLPIVGYLGTHVENAGPVILFAPIFGWGFLFYRFHRWWWGFHTNRKQYGLGRAPRP